MLEQLVNLLARHPDIFLHVIILLTSAVEGRVLFLYDRSLDSASCTLGQASSLSSLLFKQIRLRIEPMIRILTALAKRVGKIIVQVSVLSGRDQRLHGRLPHDLLRSSHLAYVATVLRSLLHQVSS